MLCLLCWRMLRGQDGRQWRGTYDLHFNHHSTVGELRSSANQKCSICRALLEELPCEQAVEPSDMSPSEVILPDDLSSDADESIASFPVAGPSETISPNVIPSTAADPLGPSPLPDDTRLSILASLSKPRNPQYGDIFRLDFRLEYGNTRRTRTFVLKQLGPGDHAFRTSYSHTTRSDECFDLACQWIKKCKCARPLPSWYPRRLLDLSDMKSRDFVTNRKIMRDKTQTHPDPSEEKLRLVETKHWDLRESGKYGHYVTLSHRWGIAKHAMMLKYGDEKRFKDGVRLSDLPQTFRDAVEFAARLPGVRYIWIDSMCIRQGENDDAARADWLAQSAVMDQVYGESFLNLSATAAESIDDGLFTVRQPELLWEDIINLNVEGIPGMWDARSSNGNERSSYAKARTLSWDSPRVITSRSSSAELRRAFTLPSKAQVETTADNPNDQPAQNIRRCVLVDTSFWERLVNQAPVNKRGWVLQERLMAPRVLHFCDGQIAWECSEFDAAEGHPAGLPNYHLQFNEVVTDSRLKCLDISESGKLLRQNRLQDDGDPDPHLQPAIFAFEIWRRIVEVYSRTAITNESDKLIALSGVARMMSTRIGSEERPARYVAGLWEPHIASQLLWKLDGIFHYHDRSFENRATRPKNYRAPSFSWASVNAETGSGIVYGEVTDRDLLIEVTDVHVDLTSDKNPFGMVESARIRVKGKLRRIRLFKKDKGRCGWQLVDRQPSLNVEEHTNVNLDCPGDATEQIFESDDVYCLPAAKGARTDTPESKYIICLLLKHQQGSEHGDAVFKRIGLTKLSPWGDRESWDGILEHFESDICLPHDSNDGYDETTGSHSFYIV